MLSVEATGADKAERLINPDEVHVWQTTLTTPPQGLGTLLTVLSYAELERAGRFCRPTLQKRSIISAGALRHILSRYTAIAPAVLKFRANKYGKPELMPTTGSRHLHFNLSHSRDLALIAVSRCEIGVDIEYINPALDWKLLALQTCSKQEYLELMRCDPSLQRLMFFNLWTSKEAYIKGRGLGLSMPLKAITVPLMDIAKRNRVDVEPDWDDGKPWYLYAITLNDTYSAALASPKVIHSQRRLVWHCD